jgi:hypothetical protein
VCCVTLKNAYFLLYFLLKIAFRTFRTWASELFVEVVLGAAPIFYTHKAFSQSDLKPAFAWFLGTLPADLFTASLRPPRGFSSTTLEGTLATEPFPLH